MNLLLKQNRKLKCILNLIAKMIDINSKLEADGLKANDKVKENFIYGVLKIILILLL